MISFKYRLELNNKQMTLAYKHAGVSRHAYNWGVNLCNKKSEAKEKLPSGIDLHKLLVKDVKSENEWYYDVSKCSPQQALRNLNSSWINFFRELKKGEIEKKRKSYIKECKAKGREVNQNKLYNIGKPKFKKKGIKDSFYLEGKIRVEGNKIKVPIFGWVKMSEKHIGEIEVKNVVVSRQSNHWFVSFKTERPNLKVKGIKNKPTIGVDLGIKTLTTLSDGTVFQNVKAYNRHKRKLKIAQRVVSKKYNKNSKQQSSNYHKANKKVAKIHYKISCTRKDAIHKLTTYLAKNHSQISIEDLNVKGMLKNHNLAGAIQDGGFYEFRRQLEYKTEWYGSKLVVIDRFFPSSKTCSNCGHIKSDLKLSDRIYKCDVCGHSENRDLNASKNIKGWRVTSRMPAKSYKKPSIRNSSKQEVNGKC